MTKYEYSILLRRKEWKRKRAIILKRDKYTCQKCGAKKYLHVHHKWYINGKKPWEVPNSYLVTLCKKCHKKVHKNKSIKSFVKNGYRNTDIYIS